MPRKPCTAIAQILRATWSIEDNQYHLKNRNLQQSKDLCLQDANCHFLWIAAADELSGGESGSRAVPVCQQVISRGHNLYRKVCPAHENGGAGNRFANAQRRDSERLLTYAEFRPILLNALARQRGNVPHSPEYLQRLSIAIDVDQNGMIDETETLHTSAAIESLARQPDHRANSRVTTAKHLRSTPLDMATMLGAFDSDKNGVISREEAASLQTSIKHELR